MYANGGVWPHNNAWYTLGLQSIGSLSESFAFFRRAMTLEGIVHSPMGHPAMYEYRFSDPSSPEYGRIDKPSFLWAGGFYLYVLYHLLGVGESEWNISLGSGVPKELKAVQYDLWFLGRKRVTQSGSGREVKSLAIDGKGLASRVVPIGLASSRRWKVVLGKAGGAYLDRVNAIVHTVSSEGGGQKVKVELSSFDGHNVVAIFVSPKQPVKVTVDGKSYGFKLAAPGSSGTQGYEVQFPGRGERQLWKSRSRPPRFIRRSCFQGRPCTRGGVIQSTQRKKTTETRQNTEGPRRSSESPKNPAEIFGLRTSASETKAKTKAKTTSSLPMGFHSSHLLFPYLYSFLCEPLCSLCLRGTRSLCPLNALLCSTRDQL